MIRALFVSDIHIVSAADPKYALFLRFLDYCIEKRPQRLFLLGDIFDLWISDRAYFTAMYVEAITKLKALKSLGVEIHYFEGNHDLDLKVYWQHQLGIEVHEQAAYFEIGNQVFRLEHGDQMDPEDRGYLFLRWLLRTPILKFLQRYLPDAAVAWIGQRASHASRDYTSTSKTITAAQVSAKLKAHAFKAQTEKAFDVIVSGHIHLKEDVEHSLAEKGVFRSFNLGTWLTEPTVLIVRDEQKAELRSVSELLV